MFIIRLKVPINSLLIWDSTNLLIEVLKKFPKDKPLMIMGWYSIVETDMPEEINEIDYLKEVDYNTLEVKGEIKYFVAIVSDKYHEIAREFP
jgi:hypothetical protein